MSFNIVFDYRFDSSGFFTDPARRAVLEAAAAEWEAVIGDEFADVPVGVQFDVLNPSNLTTNETVTLTDAIDDLIIFVGAKTLSGSTLGMAGPTGYSAQGDFFQSRVSDDFRSQGPVTDFEPWAGSMTFNSSTNWNFDLAGPVAGQDDFLSVAVHEIGHILGIGTSAAFSGLISGDDFLGVNATVLNGGTSVPLHSDDSHVEEGFAGDTVALDPSITVGERKLLSEFDKAILADIGYQVTGYTAQGSTPPIATNNGETIFGTIVGDSISGLDGADQIQGEGGDDLINGDGGADILFGHAGADTLNGGAGNDQIQGGAGTDVIRGGTGNDSIFGDGGADIYAVGLGDGQNTVFDFEVATEVIRLIDSGFASAAQALAAISKPFSNVSRLTLTDGTYIDVFHAVQSGTPLTQANIELVSAPTNTLPAGDVLVEGVATSGQVLSANVAGISDVDGLGPFTYAWLRNGTPINGATAANYTLAAQDVGAQVSVRVSFLDEGGTTETVTSAATATVAAAPSFIVGTPANNVLTGGDAADTIEGLAGNDTITGGSGDDRIDGGAGSDTAVYTGNQTSYTVTLSPTGTTVTDRRADGAGTDTLIDMEFLDFDTNFLGSPFDLQKFGGPAGLTAAQLESFIELYIAYFNRAPDAIGLNFWGTAFAIDGLTLEDMAALFGPQPETLATYPEGTSNNEFATSVYNNVLGRTPDQDGIGFWVGLLDQGAVLRDQFILQVLQGAKSDLKPENGQAFVDQQIADRAYLETKTDIGAYFAVHKGMSDSTNAAAAMQLFLGTPQSASAAVAAIDGFYTDALDPTNGEFLMPLIGVLDEVF
ncbi:MAG: DUF4214 domain-containing protein [Sulfitobacter sp.]|nr:DUF4214 domain-containing protein [Sulfitobacter sp.]